MQPTDTRAPRTSDPAITIAYVDDSDDEAPKNGRKALPNSEARRPRPQTREVHKPLPRRHSPVLSSEAQARTAQTAKALIDLVRTGKTGWTLPGTTIPEPLPPSHPPAPLLQLAGISNARSSTTLTSPATTTSRLSEGGSPHSTNSPKDSPPNSNSSSNSNTPHDTPPQPLQQIPLSGIAASPSSTATPPAANREARPHEAATGASRFQFPQPPAAREPERPDYKSDESSPENSPERSPLAERIPTPRRTYSVVRGSLQIGSPESNFLRVPTRGEAERMLARRAKEVGREEIIVTPEMRDQEVARTKEKAANYLVQRAVKEKAARKEMRFGLTPDVLPRGVDSADFDIPWKNILLIIAAFLVAAVAVICIIRFAIPH